MKAVEPKNEELIDSILETALRRVRSGQFFDLEEYCRQYPELADQLRIMLPALVALEKPVLDSSRSDFGSALPDSSLLLELADFQIISEIGRGAMGVVYEAIQRTLGRRVALKVMFHAGSSSVTQPARFQREAEIAARLHHTNIIPVFEAGESAGFVYYAMQLIEGANLQQLIAAQGRIQEIAPVATPGSPAFHSDETIQQFGSTEKDLQSDIIEKQSGHIPFVVDLSPQSCGRIALQVAEGLDFAHQRGILHRDIKPSNIMLDRDGRAWIADFGLAKSSEGDELTATGDVVGTVRYLAPERFRGQSDHRSDIYALGLTLYEALEWRPAFQESDRARLIARILDGTAPKFSVRVPPDLATICLKCVQQIPADRYATANELAADLRSFLDGRPIAARPLSIARKFFRWCDRNRLIAALTALIILGAGLGIVLNQWQSRNLRQAKADSKASSMQADRNQMDLLNKVDSFCRMVSEDRRAYRGDFRDLRNLLLESANELSTQTASQSSVPEHAKFQLASIFERLAKLRTSDTRLSDSENFLIRSRDLILELSPETREDLTVAIELAAIHRQLALVYRQMGENDAAQVNIQESIRILDRVLERGNLANDVKGAIQAELARTFSVLGDNLYELRQLDSAEAAMTRSIQVWEVRLLVEPEDLDATFELANQWTRLGAVLVANLKKWREAEKPLDEAIRLYKFLAERMPEYPDIDFWHAKTLFKKAKWLFMAGQVESAIATQRSAIAILDKQLQIFELDLAVHQEIGISLRQLADFLLAQDRPDPEVMVLLDRSEKILSLAVAGDPDDLGSSLSLQKTRQAQADLLRQSNDNAGALEKIDLAIKTIDAILKMEPGQARAIEDRFFAAVDRAEILTELSRVDDALSEWDVALKFAPAAFIEIVKMNRTRTIAWAGNHRQATDQAEATLERQRAGSGPNRHLFSESAVTFAAAAQVVLLEVENPESMAQSERYAKRAIELLGMYQDAGGNVTRLLEGKRDLQFLVDRPDFQALKTPADATLN